jgi:hypothetical protein
MDGAKITFPAYALAGAIGLIVSDEVATLTAERDRLEKQLHLEQQANAALREQLTDLRREACDGARRRLELQEGLEPFAAKWVSEIEGWPVFLTATEPDKVAFLNNMAAIVRMGDLRRAAELLAPATGGGA